ncbi:unnamed protein product [Rhizoctonia solani]|uniref:Uncharacterized protein n=1 Tax=Rhizoctonia solani TaxID=456999 RepID=A0A8H3I4J9_9AGAM|nr:unnamed protein product [Rhizoctonia solani]
MSGQIIDRSFVMDMHPKTRTIHPSLRSKAAEDLRAMFAGMYPIVRLVYHRPRLSSNKVEHIFVLFESTHARDNFCRHGCNVDKSLRAMYRYQVSNGHTSVPDSVIKRMKRMVGRNDGAVVFRGPIFGQEQETSSGNIRHVNAANELYEPPQIEHKRPRENSEDEFKRFLSDLKRIKYEVTQKYSVRERLEDCSSGSKLKWTVGM